MQAVLAAVATLNLSGFVSSQVSLRRNLRGHRRHDSTLPSNRNSIRAFCVCSRFWLRPLRLTCPDSCPVKLGSAEIACSSSIYESTFPRRRNSIRAFCVCRRFWLRSLRLTCPDSCPVQLACAETCAVTDVTIRPCRATETPSGPSAYATGFQPLPTLCSGGRQ